jgi:glycosyltransferase involved in cell wall biosynthesis
MGNPVLTIFYQFDPWEATIGGIQTLIRYYIKYAPPDFEVRLVGTGTDPSQPQGRWYPAELDERSLQFMPLFLLQNDNTRQRIPTSVRYTLALRGKNLASDFMHFHRLEPTLMTRKWAGEKMLFIHNDIHQQIKSTSGQKNAILWRKFPQLYFALEGHLMPQFQHILSCNSDAVTFYQQQYPQLADRIQLIRNTVDNEQFYPLEPAQKEFAREQYAQQRRLPSDTRFLLFAGRLHPQKDPILLVQAIAALQQIQSQSSPIHLLIAGEGELMEPLQVEIARLGLQSSVSLLGAVALPELAALHRLASAVILTSAYEGLPLVVLEALASGTPVVTTNAGETPKLLSPGSGIVCEYRTPEAIARSLADLLNHSDQFPSHQCVSAAEPFSVKTVTSHLFNLMRQRWQRREEQYLRK